MYDSRAADQILGQGSRTVSTQPAGEPFVEVGSLALVALDLAEI